MGENFILLLFVMLPIVLLIFTRQFFRQVRPQMSGQRIRSLVFGNTLVLLLLLSVLTLGGEVYFRFFYDSTDSFGLCKTTQRWFARHFERNATGFRDSANYMPTVEPGKRRVSFFGDSITAGHGIADVEDRFANIIRATNPNLEIHVLAQCGLDTGKQLELVHFLPESGYETDIVVLVYFLNDISDITPEWQEIGKRLYESPSPGFLVSNSYLFDTINARLRMAREPGVSDYYSFVRDAYEGSVWDRQKDRLTNFRDTVAANGGTFYVVTFPFLHALGDDYAYRDIHKKLNSLWLDLDVPHLDLLRVFEGMDAEDLVVSSRDAHPNESAHALAAREISTFLVEQIESEPGSE